MTTTRSPDKVQPRFHSVAETARILGVSEMTLYRAIRGGQFPAVQLMGRLIIPARVIDDIIDAAIDSGALVDTEDWTPDEGATALAGSERSGEGRPRPGANQTGAGSPVTQQVVRGDASSVPDGGGARSATSTRRRAGGVW